MGVLPPLKGRFTVCAWYSGVHINSRREARVRIPLNCAVYLSFSKTLTSTPHCCFRPRCIDGYPLGCESYLSLNLACVRLPRGPWSKCSPGSWEGALWVQDWYWIQRPGVMIRCKALWVVSHFGKALYIKTVIIIIIIIIIIVIITIIIIVIIIIITIKNIVSSNKQVYEA